MGGTVGPGNPQFSNWNFFANVEAFGLVPARPNDRMGFAGWVNGVSNNFKELTSPVIDLRSPWGLEMYYNYEINPWCHLTGDVQLAKNQRVADDIAFIPGVRLVIDF